MKLLKISRKLWKFNLNGLLSSYNETATCRLGKWRDHFGISGSCLSLLTFTRWWNSLITLPRPSNFILRVSCVKQSRKGGGLVRVIAVGLCCLERHVHIKAMRSWEFEKLELRRRCFRQLVKFRTVSMVWGIKPEGKKWSSRNKRSRTAMMDCSEWASLISTYLHWNFGWPRKFHVVFGLLPMFQQLFHCQRWNLEIVYW